MAVLELSDVEERLEQHAATLGGFEPSAGDLRQRLEDLEGLHRELQAAIERLEAQVGGRGVPVSQAAEYLSVSRPTVRAWLERGVLERVGGQKPLRITSDSLRHTQKLLGELRSRGRDRDWLRVLVDYVHDAEVRRRPTIQRGLEELRRGETESA